MTETTLQLTMDRLKGYAKVEGLLAFKTLALFTAFRKLKTAVEDGEISFPLSPAAEKAAWKVVDELNKLDKDGQRRYEFDAQGVVIRIKTARETNSI